MAVRTMLSRRATVLTTATGTLNFGSRSMGCLTIRNLGPASIQFTLSGTTATGVDADNQPKLAAGEALSLPNVIYKSISIYCMTDGASAQVDAIGQIAPAN